LFFLFQIGLSRTEKCWSDLQLDPSYFYFLRFCCWFCSWFCCNIIPNFVCRNYFSLSCKFLFCYLINCACILFIFIDNFFLISNLQIYISFLII